MWSIVTLFDSQSQAQYDSVTTIPSSRILSQYRPAMKLRRRIGHRTDILSHYRKNLILFRRQLTIFTVRRYALHGFCDRNSVRLSVCPSVCPCVTLVDCVHMVGPTIVISAPYGSPIILVSGDITFIPKFEGGHPERSVE